MVHCCWLQWGKWSTWGFDSFSECFPGVKCSQKWWCNYPIYKIFFLSSWSDMAACHLRVSVHQTPSHFFMVESDASYWDTNKTNLKMNSSNVWLIPEHLINKMKDEEVLVQKSFFSGGTLPRKSTISITVVDLKTPECRCSSAMLN